MSRLYTVMYGILYVRPAAGQSGQSRRNVYVYTNV
jgi:hypothetical protein